MVKDKNKKGSPSIKFRMWLQKKKRNAVLGTVRSTIRNMINGVTNGYKFKMVLAYSHFPIVVNVLDNGRVILMLFLDSWNKELFGFQDEQENWRPRRSFGNQEGIIKEQHHPAIHWFGKGVASLRPNPTGHSHPRQRSEIFLGRYLRSRRQTRVRRLIHTAVILFKPYSSNSFIHSYISCTFISDFIGLFNNIRNFFIRVCLHQVNINRFSVSSFYNLF